MIQQMLRPRDDQLWMLIANNADGILVVDQSGYICFANPAAAVLFGQPIERLQGRLLGFPVVQGNKVEVEINGGDGAQTPLGQRVAEMHVAQIPWEGTLAHLVTLRDITDRKSREALLEQRTRELEGLTQDLEIFSYTVSHNLWGYSRHVERDSQSLLEPGGLAPSTARTTLERILETSRRMKWMIEDLLRLSRLRHRPFQRDRVSLTEVAQTAIHWLRYAEPQRTVEVEIAAGMFVEGDRNLLEMLLENLLGNAWKYTRYQSAARIEVGELSIQERLEWRQVYPNLHRNEAIYFVRDNGIGFNEAHQDKLFVPFQRLPQDPHFEGNGIGLAIAKRVVKRHDGEIWGQGTPGRGAIFYFSLGMPWSEG